MKMQLSRSLTILLLLTAFGLFSCGGSGGGSDGSQTGANTSGSNSGDSNTPQSVNIPLIVKETLGIARVDEMVHNGIPISMDHQLTSTDELIIETAEGTQIPAAFEVLSRWAGGKDDTTKYIQWLLVSFPASVDADADKTYYLTEGTPVAKTDTITLTNNYDNFAIDTGSAQFIINKNSMNLFDSISQGGQTIATGNGGSHSTIQYQSEVAANAPEKITIERQNEHYLVIKVEGYYDNTPVGAYPNDAPISYKIRYEFFAGSPTVIVNHKFFWAGSGSDSSNGRPSGDHYFTMNNVSLSLPDMIHYSSADIYADSSTYLNGNTPQAASIAQRRKTLFSDPHVAELINGSDEIDTEFATQPMLINRSDNGALAVSIDHMKYFEPQSIETDENGKLKVNTMAEPQYFADYQGAWARVGISALPQDVSYDDTVQFNYAPLNNRLFAFPTNSYTVNSGVFLELTSTPDISSDQKLQNYYNKIKEVTNATRTFLENESFHGLMTWGSTMLYPYPLVVNETDTWDKIYTTNANTDMHSSWNNVNYQFALEGDASILYDLSFMAARRMLHTQIIQPDRDNSSFFMGWGYAGYGRYRADGNSMHTYFENLYNYYYLTGDMEVIDVVKAGGENKSGLLTRDDGELDDPTVPPAWGNHHGRSGTHAALMFNFLGHTYDANYLDDFKHMYEHVFSANIALLTGSNGTEYGFIISAMTGDTSFGTEQFWMGALYPMHSLYILHNEWGDLELGVDNIPISRVYKAVANGYMDYLSTLNPNGYGTWNSTWINVAGVSYSGDKIGGTITSIEDISSSPPSMYNSGKFPVVTFMLRAGKIASDNDLTQFGFAGIDWADNYEEYNGLEDDLWAKVSGIIMSRFHHAMAYIESD